MQGGTTPPGTRARAAICVPELREGRGAFRLFVEGDDLFDAMIAAIGNAERDIRMESYIVRPEQPLSSCFCFIICGFL